MSDFGGGRWLVFAIAPAVLLALGVSLVPRLGRHPNLTGGVMLAGLMVLASFIITAASGNLS